MFCVNAPLPPLYPHSLPTYVNAFSAAHFCFHGRRDEGVGAGGKEHGLTRESKYSRKGAPFVQVYLWREKLILNILSSMLQGGKRDDLQIAGVFSAGVSPAFFGLSLCGRPAGV